MNILSTIHSKYQGETMFCFVCVATVFGYILGVNRVIDAIISKHSDETRVKTLNKYTQTNFGEIAELLASNNLILSVSPTSVVDDVSSSSDQGDNSDVANETNNETSANLNSDDDNLDKQEKKEDQEKQVQENTVMSPSSTSSSVSTSEEDYELVRKNENVNHLKNKKNMTYFEWLNIF